MRRRTIGTIVLLALLSVVGVVLTQVLWLDRAFRVQREQVQLQKQQQNQLEKQFNDRVVIALYRVTQQLLTLKKDSSDLFDAVRQARPNYFAVAINDTVHPYLLESLLKKEFSRHNIGEDFEYGVYDCFTDSIVYGNYVSVDTTAQDTMPHSTLLKLDKDGHYFGVYFPRRNSTLWEPPLASASTWMYPALVSLIVFLFFGYSLWVILRQKRLSEMKNDFIGNMTHELKTPISTIALSSEVLGDPAIVNEPQRLKDYAGIIRTENERLRTQVERVLQLATLDRDQLNLKREAVDMHRKLAETASSFRLALEDRKGRVELDLRATRPTVTGDPVHLQNVLFNLVDNAIKYCDAAPLIHLRTRDDGRWLVIEVADNGIGMGRDVQRHIFERFYRAPTGNVHNVKGFGLGLHYVQQIVHAHMGRITVASAVGKGSTFTVRLAAEQTADGGS